MRSTALRAQLGALLDAADDADADLGVAVAIGERVAPVGNVFARARR